jgi:amino acid transporter
MVMEKDYKLSLSTAILINLNIMLSAGIFLNTITLAKLSGSLGPLSYLIVGTLMLPIILSMAKLVEMYPTGSFYSYGAKQITPAVGFLSSWCYFTGKLASSAIMIHFATLLIKLSIPSLAVINNLYIDVTIITTFAILNTLKMQASSTIQHSFMILKSIPIIFIILVGILFLSGDNLSNTYVFWQGIPISLPFVIYAFAGFEASCSLSQHIENPKENGPKAILYSFSMAVLIAILYQFSFFSAVGSKLLLAGNYFTAFPIFFNNIFGPESIMSKFKALPQLAIAASSLGGAYGIFFSNHWNLYEVAMHNFTFFSDSLTRFNKHKIPFLCIITEAVICISYIILFSGSNIILQQIAALGCMLTYFISTIATFKAQGSLISGLGLLSSFLLLIAAIFSSTQTALTGIVAFCIIIMAGLIMYMVQRNRAKQPTF